MSNENDGLTKDQMLEQYEVVGFAAYMCMVKRKSDGVIGTFAFDTFDGIRKYYGFQEA
jgi:hypothetical protein